LKPIHILLIAAIILIAPHALAIETPQSQLSSISDDDSGIDDDTVTDGGQVSDDMDDDSAASDLTLIGCGGDEGQDPYEPKTACGGCMIS